MANSHQMTTTDYIPQVNVNQPIIYGNSHREEAFSKFRNPHRVDSGCFIFIERGNGEVVIDMHRHNVGASTFITLLPGKVLQIGHHTDDFYCEIIGFSPSTISDVDIVKEIVSQFQSIASRPAIQPDETQWQQIMAHLRLFVSYYECAGDLAYGQAILKNLLMSLLHYTFSLYETIERHAQAAGISRKEELVRQFTHLLTDNYRTHRTVNFYADQLCVSPKYLSAVVKDVMGKKALQVIADTVILEAKSMIKNSDMTILQIADALNFTNVSFFCKYFKKYVGISPKQYRHQTPV